MHESRYPLACGDPCISGDSVLLGGAGLVEGLMDDNTAILMMAVTFAIGLCLGGRG